MSSQTDSERRIDPGNARTAEGRVTSKHADVIRLRGEAPRPTAWRDLALCLTTPGDWVGLPVNLGSKNRRKAKEYELSVCEVCEVVTECLEQGMTEPLGIWGGMMPNERREL